MRPLIGVTPSVRIMEWAGGLSIPAAIGWSTYTRAVADAGGVPLLLLSDGQGVDEVLAAIDGLLLSGGADLDPTLYGDVDVHPAVYGVDAARDAFELALVRGAIARNLPVLAICRGVQVLNVALGGTLYQDLPDQHPAHREHSQEDVTPSEPFHAIRLEADSCIARLVGATSVETNSFHHQGLKVVAPDLRAVGWAPDGLVEGVEHPDSRFVVGVQWHPEAMVEAHAEQRRLFEGLVAAASSQ